MRTLSPNAGARAHSPPVSARPAAPGALPGFTPTPEPGFPNRSNHEEVAP